MKSPGYLLFVDPITLFRLLQENRGCDLRYLPRVVVLFVVALAVWPLAWLESLLFDASIARTPVSSSPLIILGHDRSGTTHLLNLLGLDPQFAYTRPSQMLFPKTCILLDRAVDWFLGVVDYRRPFDNVRVGPGSPQDDECPLIKLTPHCEYHKYSFPRNYRHWLDTYVFDFTVGSRWHGEWRATYLRSLKKAAFLMRRERCLLKSPASMANLEVILELFPDAKFVHIKRNPYDVVPSQMKLHKTMIDSYSLQKVTDEEIEDFAFYQYRGYMEDFARDKGRIADGNLVEIRYEEFVQDRVGQLRALYRNLDLGSFEALEAPLSAYIESIRDYERNRFDPDPVLQERIARELRFAFADLGYDPDVGKRASTAISPPAAKENSGSTYELRP